MYDYIRCTSILYDIYIFMYTYPATNTVIKNVQRPIIIYLSRFTSKRYFVWMLRILILLQ